jgi:hypothetical protein
MHNLLPLRRDLCHANIDVADRSQNLRVVTAVRQKQVLMILQCLQSSLRRSLASIGGTDNSYRKLWASRVEA